MRCKQLLARFDVQKKIHQINSGCTEFGEVLAKKFRDPKIRKYLNKNLEIFYCVIMILKMKELHRVIKVLYSEYKKIRISRRGLKTLNSGTEHGLL